jgi:hypothetical protein
MVELASHTADISTLAAAEAEKCRRNSRSVMAAAISPDGCHIFTALGNTTAQVAVIQWDITPGAGSTLLQMYGCISSISSFGALQQH